jgi:hypothetical protein
VASAEVLTLKGIAQRIAATHQCPLPCSQGTLGKTLKAHGFSFKRTRISLKKRNPDKFATCAAKRADLKSQARKGESQLIYFDEAGFAASPPVQRAKSRTHPTTCILSPGGFSQHSELRTQNF